ncbi:MAG: hypothetical protein R3B72_38015 [Polyangiaceae bacterium]
MRLRLPRRLPCRVAVACAILWVAFLTATGCGTTTDPAPDPCPSVPPTDGATCVQADLECLYADDCPDALITAHCDGYHWSVYVPQGCAAARCPESEPLSQLSCAPDGMSCYFAYDEYCGSSYFCEGGTWGSVFNCTDPSQ